MKLAWGVVLVVCLGCSKKEKEEASASVTKVDEADKSAGSDKSGKTDTPAAPAKPPAKPVTRAEARARLDAWLAAQNNGDFEAYKAQYASEMVGIKRVRDKATTYDRDGWLKDRKRMFRKTMVVEAEDVELEVDARRPAVSFTQTWSSGTFKDKGPKRLTLVREGDAVLIAREEMLSSKVDDSNNKASAAIKAIEAKLGASKGEELEVGIPGLGGYARRYTVDGEVVKVWDNLSADHQDYWLTFYYKGGRPFYVSYDSILDEDVEYDRSGGTADKTHYTYREYLLSNTAITDAFYREHSFESGARDSDDRMRALPQEKLTDAIGNDALFKQFVELARVFARPGKLDNAAYEAAREALEIDD